MLYARPVICPRCGTENADAARFCNDCGDPLTDSAAARSEERKIVSVLFCDLVGFTAASEGADPEDVRARIRPYHASVRHELERYGGTVEKFIGDAVMAVFGAPAAHEDDPERAVRAGLRIIEAIAELNEREPELKLEVRVGINTGPAVVALQARPEQGEGIVAGDVVNTAARIQAAAGVNEVAVSEETYRQTERIVVYEPLAPVNVKGKSEPVHLYRAVEARGRFGADLIRTQDTLFVGREVEKTLLQGLFDRCARDSTVELVTLVGEPGVGKSRLCAELSRYVDERPELIRWRQGRCLPYGEGITFWALGELVKSHAGIFESDSPECGGFEARRSASGDRGARLAQGETPAAARDRLGSIRIAGGVLRRVATLRGIDRLGRAGCRRHRGSALGRRPTPRVPLVLRGVGGRRAAPARLHRPPGTVREARLLGRRDAQRAHDQSLPALRTRDQRARARATRTERLRAGARDDPGARGREPPLRGGVRASGRRPWARRHR